MGLWGAIANVILKIKIVRATPGMGAPNVLLIWKAKASPEIADGAIQILRKMGARKNIL